MKAKIFRFSGYFVDADENKFTLEEFKDGLVRNLSDESPHATFQQLHVEESDEFELDGELEKNCDLALLTRHFKHTKKEQEFDRPLPKKGQIYRHFKLGKLVTVVGIARHTETEELTVVYEYEGNIWNRPLSMFMNEVDREKYPDAKQKYRLELIK